MLVIPLNLGNKKSKRLSHAALQRRANDYQRVLAEHGLLKKSAAKPAAALRPSSAGADGMERARESKRRVRK